MGQRTRVRVVLAGSLTGLLLLAACGPANDEPIEPGGPDVDQPSEEPAPEDPDPEDPDPEVDPDGDPEEEPPAPVDPEDDGPEPDPELLADPCGPHEGREMDAFIDLVAPVQDQRASGEVDLVGCSNVFEATVVWNLLDGDGRLLDEGFTTAECGTGCVGAFRDVVPLDAAAGEPVAYLQVFSEDMSGAGGQLYLVEVMVVLE